MTGGAAVAGRVFNVQRYSFHDGPGIRTTVFLKGCPLAARGATTPRASRRTGAARRRDALRVVRRPAPPSAPTARLRRAPGCARPAAACVEACPTGARQLAGRAATVDDVMREVLRDRVFYDESGGGVTFSGGEPLAQPEFLAALLDACRAAGLHTAVDTCGFAPRERLLALAPLVDLFLCDLKLVDDARHRALTGAAVRADPREPAGAGDRSTRTSGSGSRSSRASTTTRPTSRPPRPRRRRCRASAASILLPYHRTGVRQGPPPRPRRSRRTRSSRPSRERLETLAAIFRERGLDHEHRRLTR